MLLLTCGVEQQEARRAHNPEVVGSNPTPATTSRAHSLKAFIFEDEGHAVLGGLAHSGLERPSHKREVLGSNPRAATRKI